MPTETFFNLTEEKRNRIFKAAVHEFAYHTYEEVKVSQIIKLSKIPRGSFYQYFNDKKDLFNYLFDSIAQEKIKYLGDLLQKPDEVSFLQLFRELYLRGVAFAVANPDYIRITKFLSMNGGGLFKEFVGDNIEIAYDYYIRFINADKKRGRIREDVDSRLLAGILINTSTTIAFDELAAGETLDEERMLKRIDGIIEILQKGIE